MLLHQGAGQPWLDSAKYGSETELQQLKNDQNMLKMEVLRVRQQQMNTESYLATVKERLRTAENKQKYMAIFMAKAFKNPHFVPSFIEKMRQKKAVAGGELPKRRRLSAPQGNDNRMEAVNNERIIGGNPLPPPPQEVFTAMDPEIQTLFASDPETDSPRQYQPVRASPSTADLGSEGYILWEKLMADDMIYEDNVPAETSSRQQYEIMHELENIISRTPTWPTTRMRDLVETTTACLGLMA